MSKLFHWSLFGLAVCIGLTISSAKAFDGGTEELQAYYAGNGFLQRGLNDMAVKEYRAFLQDHPNSDKAKTARYGLAVSLFRLGKFEEAAKEAQSLDDPKFEFAVEVSLMLGQCHLAAGQTEEAVKALKPALKSHGDHKLAPEIAALLTESLYKLKKMDQAASVAADSLRKWPDSPTTARVRLLAAYAWFEQGKSTEAAGLLDELLAMKDPGAQLPSAMLLRGRIWVDSKSYDQALAAFQKASASPELADEAAYWMAKCELRRGKFTEAAGRLTRAIKKSPQSPLAAEMAYDRSVALVRSGETERAVDQLREFQQKFPDHVLVPDGLELLASALHQGGKYDESAKVCDQLLAHFADRPQAAGAIFLRAENEFLAGKFDEASADYRRFLESFAADERAGLVKYRLGLVLARTNHRDEAAKLLEQAAGLSEKDARLVPAVMALANVQFDRSEWKNAGENFAKYLLIAKDAADQDEATLKLGLCRARQEKPDDAIAQFDKVIAQFPKSPHVVQAIFERGQVLIATGKSKEAAAAFEEVLSKGTDSRFAPYARRHLAAIALKNGDARRAASLLADMTGKEVSADLAADALLERGEALIIAQDYKAAQPILVQFVETYPDHARKDEAQAQRAIVLARLKQWEEARKAIKAIDMEKVPQALRGSLTYENAWCQRELGHPDDAAKSYRELLEGPEKGSLRWHAMLELAAIEQDAKRFKQASELLTKLDDELKKDATKEAGELESQVGYRRGICQFELGQFEAAAATLASCVKKFPNDAQAIAAGYYTGESLFRLGRFEAAIAALENATHSDDADLSSAALLRAGESLAQLQRWPKSEEVFAEYLRRFANRDGWHQAMFGVAWARENQGRHNEAMESYRQLVAKHKGPTAARAQFQIGECLFALKKYEEAVRELLKVDILYAYPEWSAAALYEAGRCFEAMSKAAEARDQFRAVTEKYRDTKWASMASQRIAALASAQLPGHPSGS